MARATVWMTENAYLGMTGVDSVEDAARAIVQSHDPDLYDCLGLDVDDFGYPDSKTVLDLVTGLGLKAVKVPVRMASSEVWDRSRVSPLDSIADRPGRGYQKIVGAFL